MQRRTVTSVWGSLAAQSWRGTFTTLFNSNYTALNYIRNYGCGIKTRGAVKKRFKVTTKGKVKYYPKEKNGTSKALPKGIYSEFTRLIPGTSRYNPTPTKIQRLPPQQTTPPSQ
eukprot:TRINITY_DN6870_c0_g1_i1.p1 TRINITY_DN6870_c0_g1~~TRINITY_DN6870_c0_g1_i1.p1  ORF type:complete len:114 (-),score=18.74 TRINITY_DN6870_c0_g1_i1:51-392(-)